MGQWAVVLAAGEGKRMHSRLPKVLHPLCGRPMLSYILDSAGALAEEVVIVIGRGAQQVQEMMGPRWRYVLQQQQMGTGDALNRALPLLPEEGQLLVLCGDTPLLEEKQLRRLLEVHGVNAATVLTTVLPDPAGYGRVIKGSDGLVSRIVEERDASASEKQVPEINTGTYCFDIKLLKRFLPLVSANNTQGEYYLTDVIAMLSEQNHRVGSFQIEDYQAGLGINDRCQLADAAGILQKRINRQLMLQGVTMIDPESVYIDFRVRIGADTVIWPQTVIEGDTEIGSACLIGPGAHLKDACLGDSVILRQSVVEESTVEAGATIGPFAYVRPGSRIGCNVKIGDFVEIKNSNLGAGTKVPHLSYVGDADIEEGVNLGAGVIIVNYDGRNKHRTAIGAGAFVGCNSNLISPIKIGDHSYIAAGSTVNTDVPPGALALARARQENKPGLAARWLKKKIVEQELKEDSEKE